MRASPLQDTPIKIPRTAGIESGYCKRANRINAVQECDARDDDSSNTVGNIIKKGLGLIKSQTLYGKLILFYVVIKTLFSPGDRPVLIYQYHLSTNPELLFLSGDDQKIPSYARHNLFCFLI